MKNRPTTHSSGPQPLTLQDRKRLTWVVMILVAAMALGLFFVGVVAKNLGLEERDVLLGATFSVKYAEDLGLDWKDAYRATLDDLRVRRLRIPAYWDRIEPESGDFDFKDLDWQIREADRYGVHVILAIGRKLPRWPECHVPSWTEGMPEPVEQARVIGMIEQVVRHYADERAIVAWQVENEPLFAFGACPEPDRDFLKREVAAVRAIDDRPIMLTESGELSTWFRTAGIADILGISTYRAVWDKYIGYFYWPITPRNYSTRAKAVSPFVDKVIVSELQAEPWSPGPIVMQPIDMQMRLMNPQHLRDNISFARRIGFPEVYLWGIEWWYWLKTQGHPELWDEGKRIFASLAPAGGL